MIFMGELNSENIENIAENIHFVVMAIAAVDIISDCIQGEIPYDNHVKEAAQHVTNDGCDIVWVQCLANGNVEMADDVYKEAKIHYDIWAKENGLGI